ncbi:hypothetical protein [Kribbella yunnanensis]|uniref:hypothetical protein n=1 Tax=Kribbella yunnanensis TaxID=190194 RepID=UPI0031DD86C3
MIRRLLALPAVVLLLLTMATPAANAGGPTSVLLSAPPQVIAFGYEDPEYTELQKLTNANGARGGPDQEQHDLGSFVRLTWLIHDMSVWRRDIIYPDAPGGPWIATTEITDEASAPTHPTWHRATDPVALVKLLSSLKLLPGLRNGEQTSGGPTAVPQRQPEAQPPAATELPTTTEAPASTQSAATSDFFTGWRWLLPGALLGALITWAATRFLRQRQWDLVDAD